MKNGGAVNRFLGSGLWRVPTLLFGMTLALGLDFASVAAFKPFRGDSESGSIRLMVNQACCRSGDGDDVVI